MSGSPAPPGITFFVAVSLFERERDPFSKNRIYKDSCWDYAA